AIGPEQRRNLARRYFEADAMDDGLAGARHRQVRHGKTLGHAASSVTVPRYAARTFGSLRTSAVGPNAILEPKSSTSVSWQVVEIRSTSWSTSSTCAPQKSGTPMMTLRKCSASLSLRPAPGSSI